MISESLLSSVEFYKTVVLFSTFFILKMSMFTWKLHQKIDTVTMTGLRFRTSWYANLLSFLWQITWSLCLDSSVNNIPSQKEVKELLFEYFTSREVFIVLYLNSGVFLAVVERNKFLNQSFMCIFKFIFWNEIQWERWSSCITNIFLYLNFPS